MIDYNILHKLKASFLDYYIVVLISILKSLSCHNTKSAFLARFYDLCDYLHKGNKEFMNNNGFHFGLEIDIRRRPMNSQTAKEKIIQVPLQKTIRPSEKRQ
jgi:hypothetical protein